jgi:Domain of unknown function (DUF1918)
MNVTLLVGDRVEEQVRSTAQSARAGVIEEVLRADPRPRYRIHWDDGHESNYTPAAGCLVRVRRTRTPSRGRRAA